MRVFDVLVLGGGPAGYAAALYAARAGLDTLVLERMSVGGQMTLTDVIDNYPGFDDGIEGFELGMKMQRGAQRFGAKTEYAEVLKVELSQKIKLVKTANGEYQGRTVIIATGADPRRLGLDGEQELLGRGVHYCAHCDGRFYKDKTVAVIGGGNSAASDALYLSRLAKKVYLVHRRDTLRATKIYHEPLLSAKNVEFLWNSTVTGFLKDQRLSGMTVRNVNSGDLTDVACDAVFVSIGRSPATGFLEGVIELDQNGYIISDETLRTNIEGVFSAGDVRTKVLRQVVTAVSDGALAAHFAEEYISQNF